MDHRGQPGRAVGPGQHRRAAGRRGALATRGDPWTVGPRPRRIGVSVGAPAAQRGSRRDARGRRTVLEEEPVVGDLPPGAAGTQRATGRLAVRIVPAGAPRGLRADRRGWRALLSVYGGRRARRPRGSRRAIWRRIIKAPTSTSPTGILDHGVLRCGWPSGPVWRCGRG